jgi:hypothetical protein
MSTMDEPEGLAAQRGRRGLPNKSRLELNVLVRSTLALSGAWLPTVFTSTVLLPQQVASLVGTTRWTAAYAMVSAAGWIAVTFALTFSGRLRDTGRIGGSDDRRTLPVLALVTLVAGGLVPLAGSVGMLAALWVAAVLAPAFAVTLLAARLADRHAAASGASVVTAASAIGAAPLIAMLVGSVVILVVPISGPGRSTLVAAVAAALLLVGSGERVARTSAAAPAGQSLHLPRPPRGAPVVRSNVRRHARLLTGVALVDTGTATLSFAIVPLVFLLPRAAVPDPGGYAELLVLAAAACALMSVWAAPHLPGLRAAPRRLFLVSGVVVALALVVGPFVGPGPLAAVAVGAGIAVGASNAATFGVLLTDRASLEWRATGLGLLNAVPSLPAVAVPLMAAPLLRSAPASGLSVVMFVAAALSAAGALIVSSGRRVDAPESVRR